MPYIEDIEYLVYKWMNQLKIPLPSFQIPISEPHTFSATGIRAPLRPGPLWPQRPFSAKPSHFLSWPIPLYPPPSCPTDLVLPCKDGWNGLFAPTHWRAHVCVCVLIVCKCMQSCISLATTVASRLPTPQLLKNGIVQMLTADYRPPLTEVGPHSRPSPCASWSGFLLLPRSALRPTLNMGASPIPGRLWLFYQTPH